MGSEDRCRERGYVGTINGEPNACNDEDKVEQVVTKMKMTMIDNKVKKMITRIQEVGDAMMSDQLRTVIAEIQEDGGDGRWTLEGNDPRLETVKGGSMFFIRTL